ncbi:hypothetical protein GO988_23310 [Hymenobacter sp. HMF4947]|uniref:Uncharacterized protein n=1 Tax=Hymenobacter ginkgonis TaxID=2682976 RepID=A0A7K1TLP0_9BACT|nr:hypothetical protein [Hymenobacter ginkgonis]MVN79272.1 hypothetical protein [Hymenobacter ginkgonis]
MAQRPVKRVVSVPTKAKAPVRPVATPLSWAAQQRHAVPPTASLYWELTYFDATNQPITDSLIALTDTKLIQCIRRDKSTQAPVGLTRQVYWPSLRSAAEGKLGLVAGEEKPVGPWTFWYDHAPSVSNKRLQVAYDAEGQAIAGTLQQWPEAQPSCKYVLENVLPMATSKLTCQFCPGTSRAIFPLDLPADALGIIFKFDIRDEAEGVVSFQNVAGVAVAFTVGGPMAALSSYANAWRSTGATPTISTKCTYFLTTDKEAAQQWYASKGTILPAATAIFYAPEGNFTNETRPLPLPSPLRNLYLCVQNNNVHTDALATISIAAMRQPCP